MIFNEFWSKEDNDIMRLMRKQGKSNDDIIRFFGKEKTLHHPKNIFSTEIVQLNIPVFIDIPNNIEIIKEKTLYRVTKKIIPCTIDKFNYELYFKLDSYDECFINLDILNYLDNTYLLQFNFKCIDYLCDFSIGNKTSNIELYKNLIGKCVYVISDFTDKLNHNIIYNIYDCNIIYKTVMDKALPYYVMVDNKLYKNNI